MKTVAGRFLQVTKFSSRLKCASSYFSRVFSCFFPILVLFLFFQAGCGSLPIKPPPTGKTPVPISIETLVGSGPSDIFSKLQLPKIHNDFQKSYLELIKEINSVKSGQIDVKETKIIFSGYSLVYKQYQKVLKEIEEHEKDEKLKCFSVMKSIILAVVFFDKITNKKMFRYDPSKLITAKIFKEPPRCPNPIGEYSIFYKDGQRFFNCSVHGILKQK